MGHRLVERLPEQDRLGLDAADAVAEHPERVDHRRVRVGPDERVREGDPVALGDHGRQELEVHLVDDAGAGRHDPQVAERGLCPAQQLVPLTVALVLALDVEREGIARAEAVDLDRMVDDEVGRHERVHSGRVPAKIRHGVAHRCQVDDGGDTGEVLEDDPRRHERDLCLRHDTGAPRRQRLDIGCIDDATAGVTDQVLEEDAHRDGQA